MKLIIQDERIVATATSDYTGPEEWIEAPNGFNVEDASKFRVINGEFLPLVPESVSRAQGKYVLIQMGLWQQVLDFVDSIEDPTDRALAEVALHDTQSWQRSSPFLAQCAQVLGLTDEVLDNIFIEAELVQL